MKSTSKKIRLGAVLTLLSLLAHIPNAVAEDSFTLAIQAEQYAQVPLLLVAIGDNHSDVNMLADLLAGYLGWSKQLKISTTCVLATPTKSQFKSYASNGYNLALFVERDIYSNSFLWRLYDTTLPAMIKGKKMPKTSFDARVWAQTMADEIWPILTGQEGFFSTKIAYCKEVVEQKKKIRKCLCVADFDGNNEQVVVDTMVIAPRWNNNLLFYSECTNSNVRLMYLDAQGNKHIASNFDGLNMLPSFAQDGKTSVYCASRGRGNCHIYYCAHGAFRQLTQNNGNNVSPSMSADGSRVYFCSDYLTGRPAVFECTVSDGTTKELISQATCPSFCPKNQLLAYTKNIQGTYQVCIYDTITSNHRQMTSDAGNKDECLWSPCGNYLIYGEATGSTRRIVALNIHSKEKKYLTPSSKMCSYPAWSGPIAWGECSDTARLYKKIACDIHV